MSEIKIREAVLNDLPDLLRFEQGVIKAEQPLDPTLRPDPLTYYDIREMIGSDTVQLVVAELSGTLIGCGYVRIEPAKHYLRHRTKAYLGFMYVEPEHRGKGVNRMIIDSLSEWAIAKGQIEMRLEVYFENEAAIRAYEKAGFSRHMIEMRKPL